MTNQIADKTIFTLRDSGDSPVGIALTELTLTYDWEIHRGGFGEILDLLYSLNDIGWHGPVTGFVEYVYSEYEISGISHDTKPVHQVEDFKGTSQLQVSIY